MFFIKHESQTLSVDRHIGPKGLKSNKINIIFQNMSINRMITIPVTNNLLSCRLKSEMMCDMSKVLLKIELTFHLRSRFI